MQQVDHTKYPVHWSPYLVTHIGEKLTLLLRPFLSLIAGTL